MTTRRPRKGSLQFWPRKRAAKLLPRINWNAISDSNNNPVKISISKNLKSIQGFICYKAGMASAYVKDNTEHSMTKGKKIVVPVTILECPPLKIFSVRFYKDGKVIDEIVVENSDKELKKIVKLPKTAKGKQNLDDLKDKDYDDIKIVVYSLVKKTNIKKTPDIAEIGLFGSLEEKLNFVKEKIGKEIFISDVFETGQLADIRGLTKGKGLSGPVKRFGIGLKQHKSEKGRRRPGSLGPWHPARVTFRAPISGQLGMFTRAIYNNKIIHIGRISNESQMKNLINYGDIKTDYILVRGSVQGPVKRQLLITAPLRPTKKQLKKNFEFIELR